MAWQKLSSTTLSSTGDNLSSGILNKRKFILKLNHTISDGVGNNSKHRFGNNTLDTGNNYSMRESFNGGADATYVSRADIFLAGTDGDNFEVTYGINISTEEKLFIMFQVNNNASGASTIPYRDQVIGKWSNTTEQFNITDINNDDIGDFLTGSNLTVMGTN